MSNPGKAHWGVVKWMFKYLRGSLGTGLVYGGVWKELEAKILGYSDADYAANQTRRRSTTGYVFKVWDAIVSWKAILQYVVALSTIKAKYIALAEAIKEAMWLKGLLRELLGMEIDTT